jgi:hypothetical protein
MGFLSGAAPVVVFAFFAGVAISALTVLMLLATICMRLVALRTERIDAHAEALWLPILKAPETTPVADLPALHERDVRGFVEAWNQAHEPLKGATTARLAQIAARVGLQQHLFRFLDTHRFHHRVIAVIALGHLKNGDSFKRLVPLLDDKSPIMSLCVARALLQIDPQGGVPKLIPLIVDRPYWSQGVVASILEETGAFAVGKQLTAATLHAASDIAPRMIRFLAEVDPKAAAPIIREALRSSMDTRIITTCLQAMSEPADLVYVRPLLSHSLWFVRMQAATTIGELGVAGDENLLVGLLSDQQWWVRYRAAQALLKLSFMTTDDVQRIRQAQADPYARDIIEHVLAERTMEHAA